MAPKFLNALIKNGTSGNNILANVPQGEVKDSFVRPAILICEKIQGKSPVYNLHNKKEFFIGKNPENNLCLKENDISDIHAKIRPEKDSYMLYDLASKSGVTVNWEKTLKRKLEHKDRIKIGSYTLVFEFLKEEEIFDGLGVKETNRPVRNMTLKFLVNSCNKLEEVSGMVKNININGARIEMTRGLQKGSIIEAGISSPQLPLIEVIAQVIWERVNEKSGKMLYDIGLQFLEMDEKSRKRLKDYLEENIL